jgi:spore germination protein KA
MFEYLYKKLSFAKLKNMNFSIESANEDNKGPELSCSLEENINSMKNILGQSKDIIYREFNFGPLNEIHAALIFVQGMTENALINEMVMKTFMYDTKLNNIENKINLENTYAIKNSLVSVGDVKETTYINTLIDACLSGYTLLLIDGLKESLIIYSSAWEGRGVEEPKTEAVVRGPREGYTENIGTNMALIRRKIKNPKLTFETMQIGEQTKTSVCVVYLRGIVNPKLVEEVRKRLTGIKTDAILESGYIEQFIEDEPYSIFPTVGNSEKPDTSAAKILEGRVCILIDGTPFALTVPMLFLEGFQNAEDYYSRPIYSSFLRTLRFFCFLISVSAPTIYVIFSAFHQELIPTTLLFSMAAGREGVPFPAVMEAGLMVITFEILREAGVRLPRPVGQAVSIVGALVIGESAVTAGLVGPILVIVVAITAVCSFVLPVFTDAVSLLRLAFLILGGSLGIFGVGIGILVILVHIVSLRSFGTPYLAPLAPYDKEGLKDTFVRSHIWKMSTRPKSIRGQQLKRQADNQKPKPPGKNE